jgi:hypothetical protein
MPDDRDAVSTKAQPLPGADCSRLWLLVLLMACSDSSNPPIGIYPPDGRYFLEFTSGDAQIACSGSVVVDFVLKGNKVSGSYGVTGPGNFQCGMGQPYVIGAGAGTLGSFEYTDTGFAFDLSSPGWHVEATSSGPTSFLGTFRFVLPAASGDSVVVGITSGLAARP